ncbi:sensor histidine kinase [Novisyntrophococcus fermenticellae]|uniref:sensor histidine kinase n=1 Tax=Novisyntrophococcus fermenticellae TaxID=2068655 RepID=UPI001E603DE0|nr:sensor histidine kinase [Novisyntrophococcus fermenticellae]
MKNDFLRAIKKHALWFLLFMGLSLLYALALWLSESEAFLRLWLVIAIGSLLIFLTALFFVCRVEKQRETAFLEFLNHPDEMTETKILHLFSRQDGVFIRHVGALIREKEQANRVLMTQVNDYEEYVESWAHEIKTPLSLLTFFLDNRRDDLQPVVYQRLDYVRSQMQGLVEQMLYYARLKSRQKDYLFEWLSLTECCEESLGNFQPLLNEKGFQVIKVLPPLSVLSDYRGLLFIINQVLSNAIKYTKSTGIPELRLTAEQKEQGIILCIKDNGIGIQPWDLPCLFQKGFTGDTGKYRKKATGMGLYLANEMAKDLKIELDIRSTPQSGTEMIFRFPIINPEFKPSVKQQYVRN